MPTPASPRKPRLTSEARALKRAREDRAHERYVIKTYGLAPGEYAAMLAAQDGRCAICTRIPRNRRLAVDHDHFTGKVRGLLCYLCNKYLGQWEGDPIATYNAVLYLSGIARDFGPIYDPMPDPLVEADSPPQRALHLPPIRVTNRSR